MIHLDTLQRDLDARCAEIDPVVRNYCMGFIKYISQSEESSNDAADFVKEMLISAGANKNFAISWTETVMQNVAEYRNRVGRFDAESKLISLDNAVQLGLSDSTRSTAFDPLSKVDIDSLQGKRIHSRVDKKKLEKAEAKIQEKLAKRVMKANYESSKLLENDKQSYEDFYVAVNPYPAGAVKGKNKDIKVEMINLSFGPVKILTDATLSLTYGRKYGLIGLNGIGKSTLLRALSRREINIPAYISILHVEQEVIGDSTPVLQAVLEADVWRKRLLEEDSRIELRLAEVVKTLEEYSQDASLDQSIARRLERERDDLDSQLVDVQGRLADMESDKAEPRAAAILAGLGFSTEVQQKATNEFSGGWRMRVALARALFCKPDLLLLDEPSNMLDVPSMAFLSVYLQNYPSTLLVVSHDRSFLDEVATDIVHQHSERLDYYRGNFSTFYAEREERQRRLQREYDKQMEYRKHLQSFIDKFRYNAGKAAEAQSRIKKLERLPKLQPPELEMSLTFRFPDIETISPPILQMTGVTFGYTEDHLILRNVDLNVDMGSRIGVIGPNGAGKTTLLKLLIEQLHPSNGFVTRHSRLRLAYFAQHHVDQMDLNMSALTFAMKKFPGRKEEEYRAELGAFGVSGALSLQRLATLSGGQKSRVAFAMLAMSKPHVLVLDEPTNHLDMQSMDALEKALGNYAGGVILVSHDISFLQSACTSLWLCENGTVNHFKGTIAEYKKRFAEESMGRF